MYRSYGITYTDRKLIRRPSPDADICPTRIPMYEFLTGLSSGQSLLWALFVLGVIAGLALLLTLFWNGVGSVIATVTRKTPSR